MAELGQTTDPRELVPGSPEAIEEHARTLADHGGEVEGVGSGLGGVDIPSWFGEAANGFLERFSLEPPRWFRASDALSAAAQSVTGYAETLRWAQTQAEEAIRLWEQGEAASAEAASQQYVVAPELLPDEDPGAGLRAQARELLDRARRQLDEAGTAAAESISGGITFGGEGATLLSGAYTGPGSSFLNFQLSGPDSSGGPRTESAAYGLGGIAGGANPRNNRGQRATGTDMNGDPRWPGDGRATADRFGDGTVTGPGQQWRGQLISGQANYGGSVGPVTHTGSVTASALGAQWQRGLSATHEGLRADISGSLDALRVQQQDRVAIHDVNLNQQRELFVGGEAGAHAQLDGDGVRIGGEAFGGGRVTGGLSADYGGIGAGLTGEAWAGAGAEADFTAARNDDGSYTLGAGAGVGYGIGGRLGGQITVNPAQLETTLRDTAADVDRWIGG